MRNVKSRFPVPSLHMALFPTLARGFKLLKSKLFDRSSGRLLRRGRLGSDGWMGLSVMLALELDL